MLIRFISFTSAKLKTGFQENIDGFDCVQVSTRHKDVKKYLKDNSSHLMTNDHQPEEEWWMNTDLNTPLPSRGLTRKQRYAEQKPVKKKDSNE
jgi:hypothetical protein